ncbi:hypothetical protein AAVH_14360, partial [Aphelenchoides avenae]
DDLEGMSPECEHLDSDSESEEILEVVLGLELFTFTKIPGLGLGVVLAIVNRA